MARCHIDRPHSSFNFSENRSIRRLTSYKYLYNCTQNVSPQFHRNSDLWVWALAVSVAKASAMQFRTVIPSGFKNLRKNFEHPHSEPAAAREESLLAFCHQSERILSPPRR